MKLFDSELKVLDVLWEQGETTAKGIVDILREKVGWSRTTTYTVIKKCIDKGAVGREEPNFICRALVSKKQTQETEIKELVNKLFGGMSDQLVTSILWQKDHTPEEIERLKDIIKNLS